MKLIFVDNYEAIIELENQDCYYTKEYDIYLDDLFLKKSNTNVFNLLNLKENKEYKVKVNKEELIFKTTNKKRIDYVSKTKTDETDNFQEYIDSLKKDEVLYVKKGTYKVTNLFLRDNITLYFEEGTLILGELDRNKYKILSKDEKINGIVLGTWEGCKDDSFASLITGINVKNVIIYGKFTIDERANLSDWWINHRELRVARRPKGIFLHSCENITFVSFKVMNTPSWNQHPFFSKNLKYIDLDLINPKDSPTTDGCNPESCSNVLILGTRISVGDDCIAIKSGKIDLAREYKTPSSNIIIRNCLMQYGHAGVTLGSENSAGINNVLVEKCYFKNTDRGLRIKSQRTRGNLAIIENIEFNNIIMDNVLAPLIINAFYKAGNDIYDDYRFERVYKKIDERTPVFNEFVFKNINAFDIEWVIGYFLGLPESLIKKVRIQDSTFKFKKDAKKGIAAMTNEKEEFLKRGLVFENVLNVEIVNTYIEDMDNLKYEFRNVINNPIIE